MFKAETDRNYKEAEIELIKEKNRLEAL